jgi:hypothetical protein
LQGFDDKDIVIVSLATKMMKPCQTLYEESTQRKGEKKETGGKDESPSKQAAQTRWATRKKGNH